MSKMQLEYWPVERLRPCANPLRKNDACVNRMAEAITAFGFRVPVLALADGEILDGHLRLKAALRLGMTEVPVLPAEGMTPQEVRAFRLLVNRSATWAPWDADALSVELAALSGGELDLALTGFDSREIDSFLRAATAVDEADADNAPEAPEHPVSRPGDCWLLGGHRLLCGDAVEPASYARLMGGAQAAMAWTDPPYNVAYEGKAGSIKNDAMPEDAFAAFLRRAFTAMAAGLRPGGAAYVAHADAGSSGLAFRQAFAAAGFKLASCLIWRKNAATLTRSDYHWQHEPILYGWLRGGTHAWHGDRRQTTVVDAFPTALRVADVEGLPCWQVMDGERIWRVYGADVRVEELAGSVFCEPKPRASDLHPTMKPVALIARMLEHSSVRGEPVLDPFAGSGSTLMACEVTGRAARCLELDPRFVDVIVRRWQDATGGTALLDEGALPFEQVAAEREAA